MSDDIRLGPSTKVARRCACQGWLIATPNTPSVGEAVERHQLEEPHKSFDVEKWRCENTASEKVATVLRRVA